MSKKQFILGVFIASVFGGLITAALLQFFNQPAKIYQTVQNAPQVSLSGISNKDHLVEFTETAKIATSSVVHIVVYQEINGNQQRGRSPFDDMLREFFGENYSPKEPQNTDPKKQPVGAGSGVIISSDGYIVTNNHVINGADEIEIVLNDKRSYTGKLVGKDPTTDLALVKIEEANLPFLKWGNSNDLLIGEWVLAVGNPFNLTSTVTAGIVSAKARNINILHDKDNMAIESFIQTDAAVNPGNSGGALVNLQSELIGINSAIASPTGAFAGYSFAIPAALAKKVVADLKDFGEVQRALLGVSIQDVDAELAKEKELSALKGVYIAGVRPDGAAAEAGLEVGDVIIRIDGIEVNTSAKLQEEVGKHRPGDKINITYLRKGKEKTSSATLRNKLGTTEIVKTDDEAVVSLLGSQFQKADPTVLEKLRLANGVQVLEIGEGKIKDAGVKKGFIVVAVDKQRVHTPADIANILGSKSTSNSGVLLEGIYPNGQRAYYGIGW